MVNSKNMTFVMLFNSTLLNVLILGIVLTSMLQR